jgi:MFS family permease
MTAAAQRNEPRTPPALGGLRLALLVLAPFALGYVMSNLYRAVNAVVAPDLVREVGVSASELGFLTAAYLFGFAGFQLPLGVLLDRFGPRKVQTGLIALTGLGALVFAAAGGLIGLSAGRALIGIGCAGGLMGAFKAVALWVEPERRALANAVVMAAGGVGIMVATVPAEFATSHFGWRGMFAGLAILSFAAAALIFATVPERGAVRASPMAEQVGAILSLYRDPVFWRIAPFVASTAGVHIGIQTLWAGPWFRDVAGFDRQGVAEHLFLVALGFLAGTLLAGAVADWLGRRGIGLLRVMTGFLLVYMATEALIILEWLPSVALVWLVFGMVGQSAILAYPWLAGYVGVERAGRANTALNFVTFLTAFFSQYAIGWIIDRFPAPSGGGYDPQSYRVAFGAFLALQVLCLAWYLMKPPADHLRA